MVDMIVDMFCCFTIAEFNKDISLLFSERITEIDKVPFSVLVLMFYILVIVPVTSTIQVVE